MIKEKKNKLQEIFKQLEGIEYGIYNSKTRKRIDTADNETYQYAKTLTPRMVLKYKYGTCYDTSILICFLAYKYRLRSFCNLYFDTETKATHLATVIKYRHKYYWIEYSFDNCRGIHGPFNTELDVSLKQMKSLREEYSDSAIMIKSNIDVSKFYYNSTKYSYFGKMIDKYFSKTKHNEIENNE